MRARIGIAHTNREIEIEVSGRQDLIDLLDESYRDGARMIWFKTVKGADIGISLTRLAFVELMDTPEPSIGFSSNPLTR